MSSQYYFDNRQWCLFFRLREVTEKINEIIATSLIPNKRKKKFVQFWYVNSTVYWLKDFDYFEQIGLPRNTVMEILSKCAVVKTSQNYSRETHWKVRVGFIGI